MTRWKRLRDCIRDRRVPVTLKRFVPETVGKLTRRHVVYCARGSKKLLSFRIDDRKGAALIFDEVFYARTYFPVIDERTRFDIERGATVIDVGANVGLFAAYAASRSRTGKVYCCEPSRDNFSRLRDHREHNGLDNMVLVPKGISDRTETATLYLDDENCGAHTLVAESAQTQSSEGAHEVIECIPLQQIFDEYRIERCDFLKVDCEGMEARILRALPDAYFRRIARIALEYHTNVDILALAEWLGAHEFAVAIKGYPARFGMLFAWKH